MEAARKSSESGPVRSIGVDLEAPRHIYFNATGGAPLLVCPVGEVYERAAHLIPTLSDRGRLIVAEAWQAWRSDEAQ